jgi:hypothetical protein
MHLLEVLPQEIFIYILTFLPGTKVASLVRVSKTWQAILENPLNEKKKKWKRNEQPTDIFTIISPYHFPEELEFRKTFKSRISYLDFYMHHYRTFLSKERRKLESAMRSLEYELESIDVVKDVCIFCTDLFYIYANCYKIDKYFYGMELRHHAFEDYGMEFDKFGQLVKESSPNIRDDNKFVAIVKVKEVFLEKHVSEYLKKNLSENTQEYKSIAQKVIYKTIQEGYQKWGRKYYKSLKNKDYKAYLSKYSLKEINLMLTRRGFTFENYLRTASSNLQREKIYCLYAQNRIK